MRSLLFVFMLCLCFISSQAQNSKVELQIVISPTYCSTLLTGDKQQREVLHDFYKPLPGYDAGLQIVALRRSKMEFITGIIYSRKRVSMGDIDFRDQNNETIGTVHVKSIHHFLEIPLKINYFLDKQSKHYLQAGLTNDILLDNTYNFTGDTNLIQEMDASTKDQNKVVPGLCIAYGYNMSLGGFTLAVEPIVKAQLLPLAKNTSVQRRFITTGVSLTCKLGR
jgi:hypothetical protein